MKPELLQLNHDREQKPKTDSTLNNQSLMMIRWLLLPYHTFVAYQARSRGRILAASMGQYVRERLPDESRA